MEHEDIEQVKNHICHRHAQNGCNQQAVLARDLQERHQHHGPDGGRRADGKARQVGAGILQEARLIRPQQPCQRGAEHHGAQQERDGRHRCHSQCGAVPDVGLLLAASAQGSAAGDLRARAEHGADRPDEQEQRTGQSVGAQGIRRQEAPDQDAVDQKAQGNRHGRQGLCRQHLPYKLSNHMRGSSKGMVLRPFLCGAQDRRVS